jgi:UV-endonuclease UvdE
MRLGFAVKVLGGAGLPSHDTRRWQSYTVLNSENAEVRRLAAVELEVQAEIMDAMRLGPESVVVLHVGGAAGLRDRLADGPTEKQLGHRARVDDEHQRSERSER